MFDLSDLNLQQPDPTEWATYDTGGGDVVVPVDAAGKAIRFYGRVPATFTREDFGVTRAFNDGTGGGYLEATISPIVIEGPEDAKGVEITYTRVNVRHFKTRTGKLVNASSAGNFLRATGTLTQPQSNEEWVAAILATAGKTFAFTADWNVYCTHKERPQEGQPTWKLRGYLNFPADEKGVRSPSVVCPVCEKALRANLEVRNFLSVVD